MKTNTIIRMKDKNRPEKDKSTTKSEENETAMMCWEDLKDSPKKGPHIESENKGEKPVEKTKNQKIKKNMSNLLKYRQLTKNLDQRI